MNIFNIVVNFLSNSDLRTSYVDGVNVIWDKAKELRSELKSSPPAIINDLKQKAMQAFANFKNPFDDKYMETSKESEGINTNKPQTNCYSVKNTERTQHHHLLIDSRLCQVHLKPFRQTLRGDRDNFYNPCSTRFLNSRLSKYLSSENINRLAANSVHLAVQDMFCECEKEADLTNDGIRKKNCKITKNTGNGTTRCPGFLSTEITNRFGKRLHNSTSFRRCSRCSKCVSVFSKVTKQDSCCFSIGDKSARSRSETNSLPNQSFDQNKPMCTKIGVRKKKLRSKHDRDQCLAKLLTVKKNEQDNHFLSFNEEQDTSNPKPPFGMGALSVSTKIHPKINPKTLSGIKKG